MSLRKSKLTLVQSSSAKPSRSLAKGLAAGLVGGIVATIARSLALKAYPPHSHPERELPAPEPRSRAVMLRKKVADSPVLPLAIGAAAGAAYGAVAEFYPAAASKDGVAFGMTLASITQEGPLSTLGFASNPLTQTARERSSEITSFVVFGVVTETVRRVVRKLL